MINCPECGNKKPKVMETRGARRRYRCACGFKFSTKEEIVADYTVVNGVPHGQRNYYSPAGRTYTNRTRPVAIPKTAADLPKNTAKRDARRLIESLRDELEIEGNSFG